MKIDITMTIEQLPIVRELLPVVRQEETETVMITLTTTLTTSTSRKKTIEAVVVCSAGLGGPTAVHNVARNLDIIVTIPTARPRFLRGYWPFP